MIVDRYCHHIDDIQSFDRRKLSRIKIESVNIFDTTHFILCDICKESVNLNLRLLTKPTRKLSTDESEFLEELKT